MFLYAAEPSINNEIYALLSLRTADNKFVIFISDRRQLTSNYYFNWLSTQGLKLKTFSFG